MASVQSLVKCIKNAMYPILLNHEIANLQSGPEAYKTLMEAVDKGFNPNDSPFVGAIAESLDAIGVHGHTLW